MGRELEGIEGESEEGMKEKSEEDTAQEEGGGESWEGIWERVMRERGKE